MKIVLLSMMLLLGCAIAVSAQSAKYAASAILSSCAVRETMASSSVFLSAAAMIATGGSMKVQEHGVHLEVPGRALIAQASETVDGLVAFRMGARSATSFLREKALADQMEFFAAAD